MSQPNATRTPRKEKVHWTDEEWRTVINAAVLKWLDDEEHIWSHLAEAQDEVLPEKRRRCIQGRNIVKPEVLEMFNKARRELLNRKEPVEAKVEAPSPVPTPTPQLDTQPVVQPVVDRATIINGMTNEELFELVKQRLSPILEGIGALAGFFKSQLLRSVTSPAPATDTSTPSVKKDVVLPNPPATHGVVPSTPPAAPPTPPRVPKSTKVLIFNFPPEIEAEIRRRSLNFDLELYFISQPEGEGVPKIPVCDWGIVNRNTPLSRRAKMALDKRPGTKKLFDAGTPETVLRKLNDINSYKR